MPLRRDQKDNAVRVLRLGAGVRVSKQEQPAGIASGVHRVLDEPAFAREAHAPAATLADEAARNPDASDKAEA
jgi:UDP:flavonoid glycosyltransferase YjiC (YdhE family)